MKPDINSIENNVDPDQLASADQDPHCFPITCELIIIIEYEIQNCINFLYTCPRTSK